MATPTPIEDQHQGQDDDRTVFALRVAAVTQQRIAWEERELHALERLVPEARMQPLDAAVIERLERRLLHCQVELENLAATAHADQDGVVAAGATLMQWWDQLRDLRNEVFVRSLNEPGRAEAVERAARHTLDAMGSQELALEALQAFSPVDNDSTAGRAQQQDQMKRLVSLLRHQRVALFTLL